MYWNTVDALLADTLKRAMQAEEFKAFRLVGGTALSLQLGHRMSADIDLFTDAEYGSIDFEKIENFLKNNFLYVHGDFGGGTIMGKSYLVGPDKNHVVKLDIYYANDPFFQDFEERDGIRLATVKEIIAMKIDVVMRAGRKKDFWDLHEVLEEYTAQQMIDLHKQRFGWTHDANKIIEKFIDFTEADEDLDPVCLRGKYWIFVKEDIEKAVGGLKKND
jgi:hypothetical protein